MRLHAPKYTTEFDYVVCNSPFVYFGELQGGMKRRFIRVLRPKGYLYLLFRATIVTN